MVVAVTDLRVLKAAYKQAKKYKLQEEFKTHYKEYRATGSSVFHAAGCALWDWDLLEYVGDSGVLSIPGVDDVFVQG
jgi:hypothetical protein